MVKIGEIISEINGRKFQRFETVEDFLSSRDYQIIDLETSEGPYQVYRFNHEYQDLPYIGPGYFLKVMLPGVC